MISPQMPLNERQRLAALNALGVLDTPAEARFDQITRLAAKLFDVPIAIISLVDADREWFKSYHGLQIREGDRDVSFCGHAILGEDLLLIPDARRDPRFADNPQVTGAMKIRFYAGCPLRSPDGSRIGALCIKDRRPRQLSADQVALLKDLAGWVEHELAAGVQAAYNGMPPAQEVSATVKALQEANEKLKAANALKDDFVAKVSHELRTPLTSVKEGLNLMLEKALGPTSPEQEDFLKTMDSEIDRLTELINNMLDIAKIESGRMRLARRAVDLGELITTLIRSYQPMAGARKIQLTLDAVPAVFVDPNRLRQVFTNLLSNAIKFTAENGTIVFRVSRQEDKAVIKVEDNGAGISAEDLPKLFKKFSQVGQRSADQPRGTGLGLAVCKELIELHHGSIEASSDLGEGTAITVMLPIYKEDVIFHEIIEELSREEAGQQKPVGLIAVRIPEKEFESLDSPALVKPLEAFADDVRTHVHRDDVVLTKAPCWVVVLAAADMKGIQAIAERLKEALVSGDRLIMGAALYLGGTLDAAALFAKAASAEGVRRLMGAGPQP